MHATEAKKKVIAVWPICLFTLFCQPCFRNFYMKYKCLNATEIQPKMRQNCKRNAKLNNCNDTFCTVNCWFEIDKMSLNDT